MEKFTTIKKLDFLSPKITFYYNGYDSHVSVISGILNIFSYLVLVSFIVYFATSLIKRKDPQTVFYRNYIEDAGLFEINENNIFHFLSIESKSRIYTNLGFDFNKFRIIGLETHLERYIYTERINNTNHWIYGLCKNENYTKKIKDVKSFDFFGNSACISKYFNRKEKKYFNVGEPGFRWPNLAHGMTHINNSFYNIIISKCNDETLNLTFGEGMKCDDDSEIDNFFNDISPKTIILYYKDNYINILNYKTPISNYYSKYEITLEKDRYQINTLKFVPSIITTNDGLIYDNSYETISLNFDGNDVISENKNNYDIYMGYRFRLFNMAYCYERIYEKVQDLLSSIGGAFNVIKIVFYYINIFISDYITLWDTRDIINDLSLIRKSNNNKYSKQKNIKRDLKQKFSMDLNTSNKADSFRNKFISKDLIIEKENNITEINIPKEDDITTTDEKDSNDNIKNKRLNIGNNSNNNKNKFEYILYKESGINSNHFNGWYYVWHTITCGSKVSIFQYYEKLRLKILDEKQLIKNYLDAHDLKEALLIT